MNFNMSSQNSSSHGLLRFRSAPSSVISDLVVKGSDSSEGLSYSYGDDGNSVSQEKNSYFLAPQYVRQDSTPVNGGGGGGGGYGVVGSMGMDGLAQPKMGSSLSRQISSPPGLFQVGVTPQNGYPTIRGVGSYRMGGATNGDLSPPSVSRLKGQMHFSPGIPSSLGMLSRISEVESNAVEASGQKFPNVNGGNLYTSDYMFSSWENDSSHISENFTSLKRELGGGDDHDDDDDSKLFAGTQDGELGNHMPVLSHSLSLPKTSGGDMSAMEKLLHFHDAVPCKIRAKRGCATHPRSIAERVRRTRISERMRKLQELVPNMEKQTNTADMLDLAVDYIKDLQKQFKSLSDSRSKCRCSASMQKQVAS